ncbi:MAG: hypothetical protein M1834_001823 [Cirrosporium novae-zelandiae]|nr:MAG: hypothetical protein M1834_001823 [Cirrosporium novae-zelandiae]
MVCVVGLWGWWVSTVGYCATVVCTGLRRMMQIGIGEAQGFQPQIGNLASSLLISKLRKYLGFENASSADFESTNSLSTMDAYPPDYITHNLPLIVLSGLTPDRELTDDANAASYPLLYEKGARVTCELPPLEGRTADRIKQTFFEADASNASWNSRNANGFIGYHMKTIGRSYILPPRKAEPPPSSPSLLSFHNGRGTPPTLHSPLSPLTPSSAVFPDGMMTSKWITKHQNLLPSAFISFFSFSSDQTRDSLQDNQLKTEINYIRSTLTSSGYRIRLAVVLVGDSSVEEAEIEERLINIRRATNLDSKHSFFFLPPDRSQSEMRALVRAILSALQPTCVEYYRDLSKHARRKRNRGSIPPPTAPPTSGTSQTLQIQGWNVRYEFKLGVFAEFRQEMDAACRNYEGAYENLIGPDVFETIAGWSPRFDEARLLADVIAIRIIRCLLWNNQTTSAVRVWDTHKNRLRYLVDTHGKGSSNYGWEAWEARWTTIMAEIIRRVDLPIFRIPQPDEEGSLALVALFSPPEKAFPTGERLSPWEYLHHEGYWLNQSIGHTMARRSLAEDMSEDDRRPPGQSPASLVASRSHLYDTYLCPEPHVELPLSGKQGFDHSKLIISTLSSSIDSFSKRSQRREVENLRLSLAKEQMRRHRWNDALKILRELWINMSWRRSGWWYLAEEVGWAFRQCAINAKDGLSVLAVDWELMNKVFTIRPDWKYDISKSLSSIPTSDHKVEVVLQSHEVISCLSASLSFEKSEGNVGEPLSEQLTIISNAHKISASIRLARVKIEFEGPLQPIYIDHKPWPDVETSSSVGKRSISNIDLEEKSSLIEASEDVSENTSAGSISLWKGSTDLIFPAAVVKAFNFNIVPRESGNVRVSSITLTASDERYNLDLVDSLKYRTERLATWWFESNSGPRSKKIGKDRDVTTIKILPKPPKVQVWLPNLRQIFYTDEQIDLEVEIANEEEETIDGFIKVRLDGPTGGDPKLSWAKKFVTGAGDRDSVSLSAISDDEGLHIATISLGQLSVSTRIANILSLSSIIQPTDYVLSLSVDYHLLSDPTTPLTKTITADLAFTNPFSLTYDFSQRLHPSPWPDYFSLPSDDGKGLTDLIQRWAFEPTITSQANEPLLITSLELQALETSPNISCSILSHTPLSEGHKINPNETHTHPFILDTHKPDIQDRRSGSLALVLAITWTRLSSFSSTASPAATATIVDPSSPSILTTTEIHLPPLNFPTSEPRVLLTTIPSPILTATTLLYTLENPSLHALTFSLTMDADENFAFSGPKAINIQLLPFSRSSVWYTILDIKAGGTEKRMSGTNLAEKRESIKAMEKAKKGRWVDVHLVVLDVYFQKALRVLPAGPRVKSVGGKAPGAGISVWVGDGEPEESEVIATS